eukprot:CAMPEP_0118940042 /NCGR_PEP_ID=MMETSP1169-20130426/30472_1 /TAXON_ID=36882 /ORGANISM="Pyramimonas obovata, Strain CCMP722" /LENGTH=100 /DNA_ID=CAMNT_0006884435 /DNA_START=531 /DNA_END=830 /DNA_ORIENTATION=-
MPSAEEPPYKEEQGQRQLAYWVFLLLGVGFLLPWNAFITAIDYFELLYPGNHADRVFSVSYMLPNLACLTLMLRFNPEAFTPPLRIYAGYTLFLFAMLTV